MVCRLYEIELAGTTDPKRRIALMFRLGRVLAEKIGDLPQAAQKLSDVVRLYPRDDKALEALASVFANPNWNGADGPERAAGLYNQIARRRHEAGDVDNAVASLRKALTAVPFHAEALALARTRADRIQSLRRFRSIPARTRGPGANQQGKDRNPDQARAPGRDVAGRCRGSHPDLRAGYGAGAAGRAGRATPGQAVRRYGTTTASWPSCARSNSNAPASQKPRLALLRELAALYHDRLGDREQAAVYLHAILQVNPSDAPALKAYAEHFRARGSFRELADLLEFATEHDLKQGVPVEELLPRLEEVAALVEGKLGDMDRTLAVWRRMWELAPGYERAREAQKRILQKTKQWDQMVPLFVDEAERCRGCGAEDRRSAPTGPPAQRKAGQHRERHCGVFADPGHRSARGRRLAQRGRDLREERALGRVGAAFAQPVRKRAHRGREGQHPAPPARHRHGEARRSPGGLLGRDPDPEVPSGRQRRFAAPGSHPGTVGRRAAPGEDARVPPALRGVGEREAPYHQTHRRSVAGSHQGFCQGCPLLGEGRQARARRRGSHRRLAGGVRAAGAARGSGARPRSQGQGQGGRSSGPGGNPCAGSRGWPAASSNRPADRKTPGKPCSSCSLRTKRPWKRCRPSRRTWATSPPLRNCCCAGSASPPAQPRPRAWRSNAPACSRRSSRIPPAAVSALEQIINEMDPGNLEAHAALRRVAEGMQDWPRVVAVAERQLALTPETKERIIRGLEIGLLCRDRLADPTKAVRAYEHVLEIDPEQADALAALAALHTEAQDGERLIAVDEKLLALAKEPGERRRLIFEMAEAAEQMLKKPKQRFRMVPARLPRRARRHDAGTPGKHRRDLRAVGRSHQRVPGRRRPLDGGARSSRGGAQGGQPMRGALARARARLRGSARGAGARARRDHLVARAGTTWPRHRRLARPARCLRAGGARPHGHQRTNRASAPARARCAKTT